MVDRWRCVCALLHPRDRTHEGAHIRDQSNQAHSGSWHWQCSGGADLSAGGVLETLVWSVVDRAQQSGGVVGGQDSGATDETSLHNGAGSGQGFSGGRLGGLLLLVLLHLNSWLLWDLHLWHLSLFDGLLSLALAHHAQDFFLDGEDLLGDLSERLDDFSDFLDNWLDNFVNNSVRLLLRAGSLSLTAWTGNVNLLNIDWARARAKLNGDWGQVGLDDHHLWGDDVLADWHVDHFLGSGGDDGGGHWANLDGGSGLVAGDVGLGTTLGGDWWGGVAWGWGGDHWTGDGGSVLADWGDEAVTLDGTLQWVGGHHADQEEGSYAELEHDD